MVAITIAAILITSGALLWRGQPDLPLPPAPTTAAIPRMPGGPPQTDSPPILTSTPATSDVTGIFIEPGDGRAPLLDEIAAARRTIDLEIYIVSDEIILQALADAQRRGVAVRVMLEEHPFGGGGGQPETFARLEEAGIDVRWGNPAFRFTHIKAMVIDNDVAIIMNQNLTTSSFTSNREFGVITNRPDAVQTAGAIFAADWARGPEPNPEPLVVSPTNARESLLTLAQGANRSLDVYAEVLRDPEMLAAFGAAEERGVEVRIVASPSSDFDDEEQDLTAAGVEIRELNSLYVHAKMILADGERAYLGSQNLSATSLDLNRELGIIVDDPVSLSRLSRTFEIDFRAASPLEAT